MMMPNNITQVADWIRRFGTRGHTAYPALAVLVSGACLWFFASLAYADHPDTTVFQAYGYVLTVESNPVVGVTVVGDNYIGDLYPSVTDSNGFYRVIFPTDGNYRLAVDCNGLAALGYTCPPPVGMAQEGDPIEVDFFVQLSNAALHITNLNLPVGNVDVPYQVQLGAGGGQPPYQWSLAPTSGNLPVGMTLSAGGLLAGAPGTFAATNLRVRVTDANAATAERTLLLVVNPRPLLTPLSWVTNRFTLRLAGAPRQNYTLQYTTNLTAGPWTTLLITNNPEVGTFVVRDNGATNALRFYRVLVGP